MYSNSISRCAFQLMALTTRYASLTAALRDPNVSLVICERSVFSDKECFAAVNLTGESDRAAYAATHAALCGTLPSDLRNCTVLLDAPLNVIGQRIRKRARAGEEELKEEDDDKAGGGPGDEYLARLQKAHAAFFSGLDDSCKRKISALETPDEVARSVYQAICELDGEPSSPATIMAL